MMESQQEAQTMQATEATQQQQNQKQKQAEKQEEEQEEEQAVSVSDLEQRLSDCEAEAEKTQHNYLHALAEMDNLRKRTARDMKHARKYAVESFAGDLLTVADNLERAVDAIEHPDQKEHANAMLTGVKMTQTELGRVFEKHGITRIDAMNTTFDPHYHQAVLEVVHETAEPGAVVQVMQTGYLLNDRLLRPAMVGVAKQ